MTRDELLERRAQLLLLYQNPQSTEQLVEAAAELDRISTALRDLPPPPRPAPPPKPRRRSRSIDGRARAAGDT
jgi:hypothetical protein